MKILVMTLMIFSSTIAQEIYLVSETTDTTNIFQLYMVDSDTIEIEFIDDAIKYLIEIEEYELAEFVLKEMLKWNGYFRIIIQRDTKR